MWFTQAGRSVRSPERDMDRKGRGQLVEVRDCVDRIRKLHFGSAIRKRDFKRSGSWLRKVKLIERQNRYLKSMWNNAAFVSRA
jgi:hypothetical protein